MKGLRITLFIMIVFWITMIGSIVAYVLDEYWIIAVSFLLGMASGLIYLMYGGEAKMKKSKAEMEKELEELKKKLEEKGKEEEVSITSEVDKDTIPKAPRDIDRLRKKYQKLKEEKRELGQQFEQMKAEFQGKIEDNEDELERIKSQLLDEFEIG